MKVKIVGIMKYKYGNKNDKEKNKDGMILHCTREDSRVTGLAVKEQRIWHEQLDQYRDLQIVKVGDTINLDYDDNKYLCGVELVQVSSASAAAAPKQQSFFGK